MPTEPLPSRLPLAAPVALAGGCAVIGLIFGVAGHGLPAPVAMAGLGTALVGASFLLSWSADAAEVDLSGGLVLAVLSLLTVLPELVIELDLAITRQAGLVSANLTGATRLLLTGATAMPLLGGWLLARRGERQGSLTLAPVRRVELAVLATAALYGGLIAALGRVSVLDGLLLMALYVLYLRRLRATPGEPPAVVGVSAGLAALPARRRRAVLAGLVGLSAVVLGVVADPFVEALLGTGRSIGIDPYLLVQSIAPAATETPEFVIAAVLALNHRPAQGLSVLLAAAVSQWTLALGALPLAYLAGGGGPSIPLTTRAEVELALTGSTTLMAVAALMSLSPARFDSWIVLTVYAIQFAFPFTAVRLAVAVVLALFTLDVLVANRRAVPPTLTALRSSRS